MTRLLILSQLFCFLVVTCLLWLSRSRQQKSGSSLEWCDYFDPDLKTRAGCLFFILMILLAKVTITLEVTILTNKRPDVVFSWCISLVHRFRKVSAMHLYVTCYSKQLWWWVTSKFMRVLIFFFKYFFFFFNLWWHNPWNTIAGHLLFYSLKPKWVSS